jgi:predicted PurR-regulated permease PerM
MAMENAQTQRVELFAAIAMIAVLIAGCLLVLVPFASAIAWAAVLCISTWPWYERMLAMTRNRQSLAALLSTLILAAILVAPFAIVGASVAGNVAQMIAAISRVLKEGPPDLPAWITSIPYAGPWMAVRWNALSHQGVLDLSQLAGLVDPIRNFLLKAGEMVGVGLIQVIESLVICFFLYRDGLVIANRLRDALGRVAGARSLHLVEVAVGTVRGVVFGIIGTAMVQGVIAGIGFTIAGVPGALLLAFATFVLAVVPVGPPLIWISAAAWLFMQRGTGWGVFMAIWGAVGISGSDNVIKPMLMARGGSTPVVLMMLGVFGGALAFGFIGLFLGPTLLAVGYGLLQDWLKSSGRVPEPSA